MQQSMQFRQSGGKHSRQVGKQAGSCTYGGHRWAIRQQHHHAPRIKLRSHAATHHIHNQPVPLLLLPLLPLLWRPAAGAASGISRLLRLAACVCCTMLVLLPLRNCGSAGARLRGGPGGAVCAGQQLQALLLVLPPQIQPLLLQPEPATESHIQERSASSLGTAVARCPCTTGGAACPPTPNQATPMHCNAFSTILVQGMPPHLVQALIPHPVGAGQR